MILRNVAGRALPKGSARRGLAGRVARAVGISLPTVESPDNAHYQYWIENVEPFMFGPALGASSHDQSEASFHDQSVGSGIFTHPLPVFSLVVAVYDGTLERHFFALVNSVKNQTYERWELIVADATQGAEKKAMVSRYVTTDTRIRSVSIESNLGISGNTNRAIALANGTFVAFVDHDDMLSPHALNEFAVALQSQPETVLIYSDEDKLTDDGDRRLDPHFKADWSPDLLHNVNYITHLTAIRRDVLSEVGPLRSECDGAQDFDLLLRVVAHLGVPRPGDRRILHVAKILYHWRLAEASTAANFSVKKEALNAGVLALNDHFAATHRVVRVEAIDQRPGFYRVRHHVAPDQHVVLVLLGIRDVSSARARADRIIRRTAGPRVSRIISDVDLGPLTSPWELVANANELRSAICKNDRSPGETTGEITGEVAGEVAVMILTGNATPEAGDWSDDLLGALLQPHVFAVAPRVVSPGRQVVDGGFVQVDDDFVPLVHGRSTPDSVFGCFEWVRNVDSLSGRAVMFRTVDCLALLHGLEELSQVGVALGVTAIRDASRRCMQIALVWSHTTFVITGSREPATSFGNSQLERVSGAILPTRGFAASYGSNGESAW